MDDVETDLPDLTRVPLDRLAQLGPNLAEIIRRVVEDDGQAPYSGFSSAL